MEWRPVQPPCPGGYEVSDDGQFRRAGGRHLRQKLSRYGYPLVCIGGRWWLSHRLVAAAFLGPIPDRMVVNHLDGVKSNNRLANLEICTKRQNEAHAAAMGLMPRGEKNGSSVLTEEQVRQIVSTYKPRTCSQKKTARLLGLKPHQVQFVVEGRVWSWLTGIPPKRRERPSRAKGALRA